ncbi:MAG TPA: hypothetical protein VNX66_06635 [Candidatus Sulfotelmatobacter sp.]|nr:hypothetical protein [Candidatus Sulfotelmatobacter sp.]
MKELIRTALPFFLAGTLLFASARNASGYAFNEIVPDVRMPAQLSGGSACPIPSRQPRLARAAFNSAGAHRFPQTR